MAVWHIGFYKTGSTTLQKAFFPALPVSYANDDPAGRFLLDEQLLAPEARPLTRAGTAIVAELEERGRPVVFSREQLCGSIWVTGLSGGSMAALMIRMSSSSHRSAMAMARRPMESLSVRSIGAIVAVPPASWMASSTTSRSRVVRAVTTT